MKGIFLTLIIITITFSCNSGCPPDITGKYINKYAGEEYHYVQLFSDSTYYHYFKSSEGIINSHYGDWLFFKEDCELVLKDWINYDWNIEDKANTVHTLIKVSGNELVFVPDDNYRYSFYK